VLTSGSPYTFLSTTGPFVQFSGSTAQTVILPNSTTCFVGQHFVIMNRSTADISIYLNDAITLFGTIVAGKEAELRLFINVSTNGIWDQFRTGSKTALATEVSGLLPIANGGTNSSTSLNNSRILVSSGGSIVEAAALTASMALATNGSGLPIATTTTSVELGYVNGVTSAIQAQFTTKANNALSNLASVAINSSLLPGTDNSINVGSASFRYSNVHALNSILYGSTSGNVTLKAAAATTTHILTLPSAQGAASTVLTNDGSGGLSWGTGSNTTETLTVITGATAVTIGTDTRHIANGVSNFTVTLSTAVGNDGKKFKLKNINTGIVTIDPNSAETIDGALTVTVNQYSSVDMVAYSGNWYLV